MVPKGIAFGGVEGQSPHLASRIEWLGADGDGIAHDAEGKPLYIPLTLPGELVEIARDGRRIVTTALLERSPDRVEPPCPHFGACGGCTLQHVGDGAYAGWKTDLLRRALLRAGFADPPVADLRRSPPGARRRMDLALRRGHGGVTIGLHERHAATIVDLRQCAVLAPALVALTGALRAVLPSISGLRRTGSAVVNLLDSGPDLLLRTDGELSAGDRTRLVAFAQANGLPRISHAVGAGEPEPACLLRPATTRLSGVTITPPPGAFLQATAEGEAAIIAAVLAALPKKLPSRAWLADLFAGVGTLSFALAGRARVQAWERDRTALAALRSAAHPRVSSVLRDLDRQALRAAELAGAAAVVLDPPWAGAAAQVVELASPVVIYVSCNPVTLARDAGVLRGRGYTVTAACPIDQFLWSSRLESVVAFAR